jgi:outer membrane beta-barrel protein
MTKPTTTRNILAILALAAAGLTVFSTLAEAGERSKAKAKASQKSPDAAAPAEADQAEQVNVEKIKEKYWAKGDENAMGVVQNRLYSKANRIQFGLMLGSVNSDPFLATTSFGANLAYHFNEYFALGVTYWYELVSNSTALTYLQQDIRSSANTNIPKHFIAVEGLYSLLYGKLSVVGKAIIYYDLHLLGGCGVTTTETGIYVTPELGLGQRFYLSNNTSLRVDYRFQYYREEIKEKVNAAILGQSRGWRNNFTHAITLGIDFMFGN